LEKVHVIANHILVSIHVAFISSLLSISADISNKKAVLIEIFGSNELLISIIFAYISWHVGIAVHEMGHYFKGLSLNSLDKEVQEHGEKQLKQKSKLILFCGTFLRIPWGLFHGVEKVGRGFAANYHVRGPFNLSVAAAGPNASRRLALVNLPVAVLLITLGLLIQHSLLIYGGRLLLGIGMVGLLDWKLADPGKLKEFIDREKKASVKQKYVKKNKQSVKHIDSNPNSSQSNLKKIDSIRQYMVQNRIQSLNLQNKGKLLAPWGFRNSGMGGRHTEAQFPESNISMQESMFLPLKVASYQDAQAMVINLQKRLQEIIENAEGCKVMGIGLEGGIASYINKGPEDKIPEQRLWRFMVEAIKDNGFTPGEDVVLALDPAMTELQIAYRKEKNSPTAKGEYLFWRDKNKPILSNDQVLQLFRHSIENENIPIVSIEDIFAEDDHHGWKEAMDKLGNSIWIIGDDNVTTKDSSVEEVADSGEINTFLLKINQIGTITEALISAVIAIAKDIQIVVSHRSQSANDPIEADIAVSLNSLGLKAGGGANSERLDKYGRVIDIFKQVTDNKKNLTGNISENNLDEGALLGLLEKLRITSVKAREENTNSGNPTVKVTITFGIRGSATHFNIISGEGAAPLGISTGAQEAIHFIDSMLAKKDIEDVPRELFDKQNDALYKFKQGITQADIDKAAIPELSKLWWKVNRYTGGKGNLTAAKHVEDYLEDLFVGKKLSDLGDIITVDSILLQAELKESMDIYRNQNPIQLMQRKAAIGMNAILSTSVAMMRLLAKIKGKDQWELIRETVNKIILKTINAVKEKIPQAYQNQIPNVSHDSIFEELTEALRIAEKLRKKHLPNIPLYEFAREQTKIYENPI